ncbi:MAG: DVUA0089 family protein [Opitutaceae bacterium]|nr:DVUA0089 family protein [Opitutaceae bacterium]
MLSHGKVFASFILTVVLAATTVAFERSGVFRLGGTVTLQLQLGEPPRPLSDGATSWNQVAAAAAADWNLQLGRVRFATVVAPPLTPSTKEDRINTVFFSRDAYGLALTSRTLTITLSNSQGTTFTESDVIVNAALTWDSYRGTLRGGPTPAEMPLDLRRILLHEFGHVLGLNHPDEATPPQNVVAVMNSTISNVETLQADDIAGLRSLYFPNGAVTISTQPVSLVRSIAEPTSFSVAARANTGGPLRYVWMITRLGGQPEPLERETGPVFTLGSAQRADAGSYQVLAYTATGAVLSEPAELTVRPATLTPETRLANISTRGHVGTGANAMICGFVVTGTTPKRVLIRAVGGGTLAAFGVSGTLANPELTLFDGTSRTINHNGDWGNQSAATEVMAAAVRVGAFALPTGSNDAALLTSLAPGNYTALVTDADNATGVALIEVYDADPEPTAPGASRLGNLSTRGSVGLSDQSLIAGLVVRGPGPRTFLIRAVGPTLRNFGLPGALVDPELTLRDATGATVRYNDDWDTPFGAMPGLRDAARRVGAFGLQELRERTEFGGLDSVMLVTLPPGNYTAEVTGFIRETGVALIEIYEMPN